MNTKGDILRRGIQDILDVHNLDYHVAGLSSMFQIYFTDKKVWNYDDAKTADTEKFIIFFQTLLNKGVFIPPSQFECCFVSLMHNDNDLEQTLTTIDKGMKTIKTL
jgi:glutamate-1-semialdehyde 2,1-aminomutase